MFETSHPWTLMSRTMNRSASCRVEKFPLNDCSCFSCDFNEHQQQTTITIIYRIKKKWKKKRCFLIDLEKLFYRAVRKGVWRRFGGLGHVWRNCICNRNNRGFQVKMRLHQGSGLSSFLLPWWWMVWQMDCDVWGGHLTVMRARCRWSETTKCV